MLKYGFDHYEVSRKSVRRIIAYSNNTGNLEIRR